MAHEHEVIDNDLHFLIDDELEIMSVSEIKPLKRGDHGAKRYKFEMPRYIYGHDMALCNKVEVHYDNKNYDEKTRTETVKSSFDEVEDFAVMAEDEEKVSWSWLVKGDATQLSGALDFCLRFACVSGEIIEYQKFSEIYKGIPVDDSIYNTESFVAENADALERVVARILGEIENGTY